MLSYFKKIVKNNQSDIILTLGIVLVALFSFGAGLLVSLDNNQGEIIIQNPTNYSASIEQSLPTESIEKEVKEGRFVGSINSNKYHWPNCSFAQRIAEQNQVWFDSEEEAQNAGYVRCGSFEKYIPTTR